MRMHVVGTCRKLRNDTLHVTVTAAERLRNAKKWCVGLSWDIFFNANARYNDCICIIMYRYR